MTDPSEQYVNHTMAPAVLYSLLHQTLDIFLDEDTNIVRPSCRLLMQHFFEYCVEGDNADLFTLAKAVCECRDGTVHDFSNALAKACHSNFRYLKTWMQSFYSTTKKMGLEDFRDI